MLQNGPATQTTIPVNIQISAGEVIGILGYRGAINSYCPGDQNITIDGVNVVQAQRLGMQYNLNTTTPREIWREFGPGTSLSRVNFEYTIGKICASSPRVPVTGTVLPDIAATATPSSQTRCSGVPITTIVLSGSSVPGTVFNWTRDNSVIVTGIAAIGQGDISGSLTNTTNAPILVPLRSHLQPIVARTPITATVLVNPTPNAVATPSSQTICSGSAITTIVLTGNVAEQHLTGQEIIRYSKWHVPAGRKYQWFTYQYHQCTGNGYIYYYTNSQ